MCHTAQYFHQRWGDSKNILYHLVLTWSKAHIGLTIFVRLLYIFCSLVFQFCICIGWTFAQVISNRTQYTVWQSLRPWQKTIEQHDTSQRKIKILKSIIDKPLFHFSFYLVGLLLLYVSHKIEPTNLAGPGLDMLVLLMLFISILYLFIRTLVKKNIIILSKVIITVVHILGVAIIIWWMNQPSLQ